MLWKNLSVGLLTVVVMMALSRLLPEFLSPVVALVCAAVLYTYIYNVQAKGQQNCMVIPYVIFCSLIAYSFVFILINIVSLVFPDLIPDEFIFLRGICVPYLIMLPVGFFTLLIMYFSRSRLKLCVSCKLKYGNNSERGQLGRILSYESRFQFKNLIGLFAFLTVVVWVYYFFFFIRINVNARDWYVFLWLTVISIVFDEIYFIFRYYNLYLDLKENGEIISQEEIANMTSKTYLRYYLICGNKIFLNAHSIDPKLPYRETIDTPFFTRRNVNGIMVSDIKKIIGNMTGISDGELRFFYGRRISDNSDSSMLRYFYFLDGNPEDYEIGVDGEWMDFSELKRLYTHNPGQLSSTTVADLTRLATIILTEKMFDEDGFKKSKIKKYRPNFTLIDVRNSDLDFQDDKWIRISMFNSDTPFYRFKRWWRGVSGKSNNSNQWR